MLFRSQRFLSQPFHVAEVFTGSPGVFVSLEDTIKGFQMIVDGELDRTKHHDAVEDAIAQAEGVQRALRKIGWTGTKLV